MGLPVVNIGSFSYFQQQFPGLFAVTTEEKPLFKRNVTKIKPSLPPSMGISMPCEFLLS